MFRRVASYVAGIAGRRRIQSEVEDELRFHLEQEIQENVARGLAPAEAERVARLALGGMIQTSESVRDVRAIRLDLWWRDIRHAIRSLAATPSFTFAALIVLTLSIGATTAIFSVVDTLMVRPLPFHESDQLVVVGERNVNETTASSLNLATPQNFLDWRDQQDVFSELGAVAYASVSLRKDGAAPPESLRAQRITADFFSALRVAPVPAKNLVHADAVELAGR
jgi:putative ABC transport system permease protein